jgi:23S rRNA (cytosine1962-C5)-methyltransferase
MPLQHFARLPQHFIFSKVAIVLSSGMTSVVLRKGRSGPTFGRHPWVFSNTIDRIEGAVADGEAVKVCGDRGDFLGYGIFNSKSDIRVRMYSWQEEEPISPALWFKKIKTAVEMRRSFLKLDAVTNVNRIIFSEGDGLSGLTVDRFGDFLVAQITSLAIFKHQAEIIRALVEFAHPKGIYLRAEKNILKAEGVEANDGVIYGEIPDAPVEVFENGIRYFVNLKEGQKTGFYADQRDHRLLLGRYAKDMRVLDLCTYTGSFALHALHSGAKEVVAVDSSQPAIEMARANAELNNLTGIDFRTDDVFEFVASEKSMFDVIVLDPPRFAPSKGSREKALRAYFKLNFEALRLLKAGGVFLTFSCSHQINRNDFNSTIVSVFRRSARDCQILYQGSQAPDHPILGACPETQYLKSLLCLAN